MAAPLFRLHEAHHLRGQRPVRRYRRGFPLLLPPAQVVRSAFVNAYPGEFPPCRIFRDSGDRPDQIKEIVNIIARIMQSPFAVSYHAAPAGIGDGQLRPGRFSIGAEDQHLTDQLRMPGAQFIQAGAFDYPVRVAAFHLLALLSAFTSSINLMII